MEKLIADLKKKISGKLPGISAHKKMYPSSQLGYDNTIDSSKTDAGVLILLYPDNTGVYNIPFIKRPPNTGPHSSQISFPGGRVERFDRNIEATALRETYEEIGADSSKINIIGKLTELYIPVSKYLVHPFVGITSQTPNFRPDKKEVDYIITYSLEKLVELSIKNKTTVHKNIQFEIPFYNINNEVIWGATSMILCEFIEILKT